MFHDAADDEFGTHGMLGVWGNAWASRSDEVNESWAGGGTGRADTLVTKGVATRVCWQPLHLYTA